MYLGFPFPLYDGTIYNYMKLKVSAGNSGQRLIPDTYVVLNNGRISGAIIWYANAVSYGLSTNQN